MKAAFSRPSFDRIALGVAASLVVLFVGLIGLSIWLGLPAPKIITFSSESGIGSRGPLGFKFSQSVNRLSLESRVEFLPETIGYWVWEDDRTAWFYPEKPFLSNSTLGVRVEEGVESQDGRVLRREIEYQVQIRPSSVIYLGQPIELPELWRVGLNGDTPEQLTSTDGGVYDFAVSPNGEWIIYSRINFRGGSDIYLIDRNGQGEKKLVDCGEFRCQEPAWAYDNKNIAYRQLGPDLDEEEDLPNSILYSVNIDSGQFRPFFNNSAVRGMAPAFSPDRNTFGYYDLVVGAIRLVNLSDGSSELVPAAVPVVNGWSPDGNKLIVADVVPDTFAPYAQLFLVEFQSRSLTRLFENEPEGIDYSVPAWSPDGEWLLVGLRYVEGLINKQIWIMRPDGSQTEVVTQDPTTAHSAYSWSPDGRWAVFQRYSLGASENRPEIMVWEFAGGEQRSLASDGALPQWMP